MAFEVVEAVLKANSHFGAFFSFLHGNVKKWNCNDKSKKKSLKKYSFCSSSIFGKISQKLKDISEICSHHFNVAFNGLTFV